MKDTGGIVPHCGTFSPVRIRSYTRRAVPFDERGKRSAGCRLEIDTLD